MRISSVRRMLYRSGSVLGDIQAAERSIETGSPKPLVRRVVRKYAWRTFGKAMRKGGL
jgi:hypothetical protein